VGKFYTDEVGRVISVSVGIDLTGATIKKILVLKPNGQKPEWTGVVTGSAVEGVFSYTTVAGDLNCAGVWKVQAYVENSGKKVYGQTATFTVYDKFQ